MRRFNSAPLRFFFNLVGGLFVDNWLDIGRRVLDSEAQASTMVVTLWR
ncbi:MAG TPA: hypothetical protein GXZ85_04745 [Firmicutes bacterium]|jgi:hypothetical protein|nr:hypothetical protein [Bacillota bacterium]